MCAHLAFVFFFLIAYIPSSCLVLKFLWFLKVMFLVS